MKISRFIVLFFSFWLVCSISVPAADKFDPNNLQLEYYLDKGVKDELIFNDDEGYTYKIKKNKHSRGLYIKYKNNWKKHGVWFAMSDGRVKSKKTFYYGKKHGPHVKYFHNERKSSLGNYENNHKTGKTVRYY